MSAGDLRIVFMGAPDFAATCLRALASEGRDIVAVYTQPPRPAGRGGKVRPTAVGALGAELGVETRHPERFRDADTLRAFAEFEPDIAIVVAYGQILPKEALETPRLGCLNLHASLLPRWRGAAPIQRAVMAGDAETGVCVMRMTEGLDEGPVILRAATPIGPEETSGDLFARLAVLGAPLLGDAIDQLASGEATDTPQPAEGVSYAKKIQKSEARIDWRQPAAVVDRAVRGLSPAPGAWTQADFGAGPERLKILRSRLEPYDGPAAAPGVALDDKLLVAAGDASAAVRILTAQRAGKAAQEADVFLRGTDVPPGARLDVGAETGA